MIKRHVLLCDEEIAECIAHLELFQDGSETATRYSDVHHFATSHHLPVASDLASQVSLDKLKVLSCHLRDPAVLQEQHPRHDRRELALKGQLGAEVQQLHEVWSLEIRHSVTVRISGLVHDV